MSNVIQRQHRDLTGTADMDVPNHDQPVERAAMRQLAAAFIAAVFISFAPAAPAAEAQRTFATADEAVAALVQAVKTNNRAAMLAVLGSNAASWISSGDAVADRAMVAGFLASYEAKQSLARDGDRTTLVIGDGHPFAFPIVKAGERWRFDTAAGREELLARRIGENELAAMNVLLAIVDAQREYAAEDRDGDGALEYAQRLQSNPGKRDGLYWPAKQGEAASPLGALVASAAGEGYTKQNHPVPYRGYYFRTLRGQGKAAASGEVDYVVRRQAIGGFAVVAYPARYGNSGVMTFIVNHDGQVFERDLGPDTQALASAMRRFNPGKGWAPVPMR